MIIEQNCITFDFFRTAKGISFSNPTRTLCSGWAFDDNSKQSGIYGVNSNDLNVAIELLTKRKEKVLNLNELKTMKVNGSLRIDSSKKFGLFSRQKRTDY